MEERKQNPQSSDLDSMMVYIDENGNFTDTPPDPTKKKEVDAESIELGIPKKEDDGEEVEHKGKVDYYNDQKGFGFIIENKTREKYFFHVNGTLEEVVEGDTVTYELEKGMKGLNAVQVKKA